MQFINKGDMRGLVSEKIGQNQVDYLDLLARNAFLLHPHPTYMGTATTRATLAQTDLFDPDMSETIRVHLEENNVPGVFGPADDGNGPTIVCVTTPRVIKDIRTSATSKWLEVQEYAGPNRKFNNEVGMWAGIRFVKSNRCKLFSAIGSVAAQTTLNGATVVGQGATASVDGYTVGQTGATVNVVVTSSTGIVVGDWVTIGVPAMPIETDATAEVRRVVTVADGTHLAFNKPLMKAHGSGAYVTKGGGDLHTSIFMGGPAVVYGVAERPHVIAPPKYDDLMIVNRYGWRGFLKFQQYRPEFYEIVLSGGSTD